MLTLVAKIARTASTGAEAGVDRVKLELPATARRFLR